MIRSFKFSVFVCFVALVLPSTAGFAFILPQGIFSLTRTQYVVNDGPNVVYHSDVWSSPLDEEPLIPIEQFVPNFLPQWIGLDALQDMRPGTPGFVFSTVRNGFVYNDGDPLVLYNNKAYYYDTDTQQISLYEPLAGLNIPNMDALSTMPAGSTDAVGTQAPLDDRFPRAAETWAFSTSTIANIVQDGQPLTLYPQNIYCYNRFAERIFLLIATGAYGVSDVDALNVVPSGFRSPSGAPFFIQYSSTRIDLVATDSGLVRTRPNDVNAIIPAPDGLELELVWAGNDRNLGSIDAFSTPEVEIEFLPGACCRGDGCIEFVSEEYCEAEDGAWQGPGSLCSFTECEGDDVGACIYCDDEECEGRGSGGDGYSCDIETEEYCELVLDGEYQGDGSVCD